MLFPRPEHSKREAENSADKLRLSMRTTAKCRYNASVRLKRRGQFNFFTTTVLSLGLIFIPLMESSSVPLMFSQGVRGAVQVFLAVSVLVYSVVINLSNYEARSARLDNCADKLKDLSREFDKEFGLKILSSDVDKKKLRYFQEKYSSIVSDIENHERNDYRYAVLEMSKDYKFSRLKLNMISAQALFFSFCGYFAPSALMLLEFIFILDMMGVTSFLSGVFPSSSEN